MNNNKIPTTLSLPTQEQERCHSYPHSHATLEETRQRHSETLPFKEHDLNKFAFDNYHTYPDQGFLSSMPAAIPLEPTLKVELANDEAIASEAGDYDTVNHRLHAAKPWSSASQCGYPFEGGNDRAINLQQYKLPSVTGVSDGNQAAPQKCGWEDEDEFKYWQHPRYPH